MKKTLKLGGLYLLVTLVVALGVIFLLPLSVNASEDDWSDPLPPVADNHLLDIVGNLMQLTDFNVNADLTITAGEQNIALNANVDLQAAAGFTDVAVAGAVAVQINDFAAALHVTYLDNTLYADFNNLHLSANVNELLDGLPAILALFGVDFTMPDFGDLDVNAVLALLEDYTETATDDGYAIVLTVAGCGVELTCDHDFNLQRAVIPALTLGDTTLAGEIALTTYPAPLALTVPDYDYVDVPQLLQLFNDLVPTFTHPFAIRGNATIFATVDGERQLANYLNADLGRLAVSTRDGLLDQLAIDLALNGAGDLYTTTFGGRDLTLGAYFNSNNTDGGVYLNFDGLKLFCGKADLADLYTALQSLLSLFVDDEILQYTNLFYFNANNDLVFNTALLNEMLGNLTADDIVPLLTTYLPYLQGLTLTADNVLTLTLVNDLLTLQLCPTADGVYQINVQSYWAAQNREIIATFTVQTIDAFTGVPTDADGNPATDYLDISAVDDLLNAVNNTVRHQEFYLSGTARIQLSIPVIGKVNVDVPVEIAINNTDPERGLVVTAHIALPYSGLPKMIMNAAPDAAGKTQDGTRDVYLYYAQGNIYLYRTEQVKISGKYLWSDPLYQGSYDKAVKLTMTELLNDPLYWLLDWGFGLKSMVLDPINEAIAKSGENNDPLDYGDLVHGFTATDGKYDLVLNLGEIAHNNDLKDFTVSITTDHNGDQSEVTALGVNMDIKVGISIVLQTTGDGLTLTTGDGVANVDNALAWVDGYQWANGETWHTIKGNWELAA